MTGLRLQLGSTLGSYPLRFTKTESAVFGCLSGQFRCAKFEFQPKNGVCSWATRFRLWLGVSSRWPPFYRDLLQIIIQVPGLFCGDFPRQFWAVQVGKCEQKKYVDLFWLLWFVFCSDFGANGGGSHRQGGRTLRPVARSSASQHPEPCCRVLW